MNENRILFYTKMIKGLKKKKTVLGRKRRGYKMLSSSAKTSILAMVIHHIYCILNKYMPYNGVISQYSLLFS